MFNRYKESAEYINNIINFEPEIGMILGSGLGDLANEVENPTIILYNDIPNFKKSNVEGHENKMIFGNLCGKKVVIMQGRYHFYEGYNQEDVTYPVRIMKLLGVNKLIVTNAAGGVNKEFPGDLMIINDHINFSGTNPLIGKNIDEFGTRFPDMSMSYNKDLVSIAKKAADELNICIRDGVYMFFSGPSYETPAEVRMARVLGADAVGMSTVPEVIVANHCGIDVIGISCITNMAAGVLDKKLCHDEVIETTKIAKDNFSKLIRRIVSEI